MRTCDSERLFLAKAQIIFIIIVIIIIPPMMTIIIIVFLLEYGVSMQETGENHNINLSITVTNKHTNTYVTQTI